MIHQVPLIVFHSMGDSFYVLFMMGLLLVLKIFQAKEVHLKLPIFRVKLVVLFLQVLNFLSVQLVQLSNFFKLIQLMFNLLDFQSSLLLLVC